MNPLAFLIVRVLIEYCVVVGWGIAHLKCRIINSCRGSGIVDHIIIIIFYVCSQVFVVRIF